MSHTPGPWEVATKQDCNEEGLYDRECGVFAAIDGDLATIAMPWLESDAHLIAAAPDMLAMLEELRECAYCWCEYEVPVGIVDRLDEVIKKARGEE